MDLKFLKWRLIRGPLVRRIVLRAIMFVLALIFVSLMQISREIRVKTEAIPIKPNAADKCTLNFDYPGFNLTEHEQISTHHLFGSSPSTPEESQNLTRIVFKELMEKNLLRSNARALCVGPKSASALLALRSMGFFDAQGVEKHPSFSLIKRRFLYEFSFEDSRFDFVYTEDLDRLSVPSLLVQEIERVLRPGGTGAILGGARSPISAFLKSSEVVHECVVGPLTLVIFKKSLVGFASFERFELPRNCPSVVNNRPYMKHIEPLEGKISYLPNFMNITSRNKLVYINLGAGEYARSSVLKMSRTYCGDHHAAFEVFIIDHKTSVLSTYVTDPGVNFVYHPALNGETDLPEISSDEFLSAPADEDEFDFVQWFEETVSGGDFVVLMMEAKSMEIKILVELFETSVICHVDELFLHCPGRDCVDLIKSLRESGVYAHMWLGE